MLGELYTENGSILRPSAMASVSKQYIEWQTSRLPLYPGSSLNRINCEQFSGSFTTLRDANDTLLKLSYVSPSLITPFDIQVCRRLYIGGSVLVKIPFWFRQIGRCLITSVILGESVVFSSTSTSSGGCLIMNDTFTYSGRSLLPLTRRRDKLTNVVVLNSLRHSVPALIVRDLKLT